MFVFRRSGWAVVAGILTASVIVCAELVFAANM
jgi:hypothetical protein